MKTIQVINARVMPLGGSDIYSVKKAVGELAKLFECSITFNFNGQEYVADNEGNIAKAENNIAKDVGYPM